MKDTSSIALLVIALLLVWLGGSRRGRAVFRALIGSEDVALNNYSDPQGGGGGFSGGGGQGGGGGGGTAAVYRAPIPGRRIITV